MTRIVQVIGNSHVGGAERHVLDLSEALSKQGHEVLVICPRPGPLPDEQPTRVGAVRAAASSAAATRADAAVRAIIPPFMFVNENQIGEPRPRQPTSAPDEWSSALVGYGAVTGGNSVVTGAERALA